MLAALFMVASAAAAPLQPVSSSPCALLDSNAAYWTPSQVKACFESVPFDESIRQNVLNVVTSLYTMAIFQFNQLGDEDPVLNQGIDIMGEFARINTTTYSSDFDFQFDLATSIYALNDGHYSWTPCYYAMFNYTQAIPIISVQGPTGLPEVYIPPDLSVYLEGFNATSIYSTLGLDADELASAQVLEIEGLDALDYLVDVAVPQAGVFQDPAQRLNYQFAGITGRNGIFDRSAGHFTTTLTLEKDNITMTVKTLKGDVVNLTLPYLIRWNSAVPFNFSSGEEFFQKVCSVNSTITSLSNSTSSTNSTVPPPLPANITTGAPNFPDVVNRVYGTCPNLPNTARFPLKNDPTLTPNYLGGRDIQFYTLPNKTDVGVIYVPTLDPAGNEDECTTRFFVDSVLGLQNFSKNGITKVLLDTTNDGGGFISLAQLLERLFTGEKYTPENNFQTVFRKVPLSQALLQAHLDNPSAPANTFSPVSYRESNLTDLSNDTNYFKPGLSRQINNHTLYTSDYISDSLDTLTVYNKVVPFTQMAPYAPSEIVITGNGLSGSACASFINFLIEYYNTTACIHTPFPEKPIEYQAFSAAQSITGGDIYDEAQSLNFTNPYDWICVEGSFESEYRPGKVCAIPYGPR
ncbi:hypothetical protein TREMEDRAFT_61166 [Tremella mesenterica DSM 1558]|uniref:uncharacterized protein n=1 Tax=Tremella mesenterica (strain ATCC 24925 / CBS 8224 / DSM 1558 / NBRC 9311 / NRRL Y-6157 / RJB 2259-6 / UBC 559-6) TaxID=578456 RepID=UPI0003F4A3C4|nr:uncharacterized protein TREMEDRAFT_61166 [Tremella mesenterica DSM 1558]EIW70658.1 hypothetical protein TREMEDRAFT_61166 [Tremella mesenterica DSM 1558]